MLKGDGSGAAAPWGVNWYGGILKWGYPKTYNIYSFKNKSWSNDLDLDDWTTTMLGTPPYGFYSNNFNLGAECTFISIIPVAFEIDLWQKVHRVTRLPLNNNRSSRPTGMIPYSSFFFIPCAMQHCDAHSCGQASGAQWIRRLHPAEVGGTEVGLRYTPQVCWRTVHTSHSLLLSSLLI